ESEEESRSMLGVGGDEVERKVGKAFCRAEEAKGNPVLEMARLVLCPRQGRLMIPREPKFGGDVVYESFQALSKAYSDGELHPKDLKAGVTAGLNRELAPLRKYFEAHPENLSALQKILQAR